MQMASKIKTVAQKGGRDVSDSKQIGSDSGGVATVPIGEVGYTFRKHFPGYGVYEGEVVKIRPGAEGGKSRRCVYSDGDREDLSLSQLRSFAAAFPMEKESGAKVSSHYKKKRKEEHLAIEHDEIKPKKKTKGLARHIESASKGNGQKGEKKKSAQCQRQSGNKKLGDAEKCEATANLACDPFSGLHDHIPIDAAAEATLQQHQSKEETAPLGLPGLDRFDAESSDVDDHETGLWLEKVASMLGAGEHSKGAASRPRKLGSSRSTSTSRSISPVPPTKCGVTSAELLSDQSCYHSGMTKSSCLRQSAVGLNSSETRQVLCKQTSHFPDPPVILAPRSASPSSSVSIECLISLADIKHGVRHGTKVFRVDDKRRVVGEVILENGSGYVEVAISGSLRKGKIRTFVVAPEECNVGDSVSPSFQLPNQSARSSGAPGALKGSSRRGDNEKADASLSRQDTPLRSNVPTKTIQGGKVPDSDYSSPEKRSKSSPEKHYQSPGAETTISIDALFYWCCAKCTMTNTYTAKRCDACDARKSTACQLSPLLEIADVAVAAATSVDDAHDLIPVRNRDAIPKVVLFNLFFNKRTGKKSGLLGYSYPAPSESVDSYFYWMCGFCTRNNGYRRSRCVACNQRKGPGCTSSVVLDIAANVSKNARTVCDALSAIPFEQRDCIPPVVLSSLVTCIAMVGRKNEEHRCLKPKAPGEDYCSYHRNDPLVHTRETCEENGKEGPSSSVITAQPIPGDFALHLSSKNGLATANPLPRKIQETESRSIVTISADMMHFFFQRGSISLTNTLRWNIRCVEDAVLCQESGPFPLGMMVRRFFTQFGFHDGRIVKCLRREIVDQENGTSRPVLVYRLLYNDGDCEDFMHHEINSLRQIYDRCSIESKASPSVQIPTGALFETQTNGGIVEIGKHTTPPQVANSEEGGIVHMKFCKIGQPWTDLQLDLKQLQTSVLRMLPPSESVIVGPALSWSCVDEEILPQYDASISMNAGGDEGLAPVTTSNATVQMLKAQSTVMSPLLEWPAKKDCSSIDKSRANDDEEECKISPELWLGRTACSGEAVCYSSQVPDEDKDQVCFMDDESCVRQDLCRTQCGWDPANALNHISWDPYRSVACELCNEDKDDHQILICDECHLGYHMYCVRPVIVNVPTSEWYCSRCTGREDIKRTFSSVLEELQNAPRNVLKFLGLKYEDLGDFPVKHKVGLDLFSSRTLWSKRQAVIGVKSRSKPTAKVESLYFSWMIQKNDWVIPMPLACSIAYCQALSSWVAAMQYVGMTTYSEELVYPSGSGVSKDMNDTTLDLEDVESLSLRNYAIFNEFKENLKLGAYPPIRIVHDKDVGFTVEALAVIRKHTLIAEYIGEVTTVERSGETSSDSLMMLLDTGDERTSLIIDPTRTGNVARFLSGINNRSHMSKKKANVRTRRFNLDGKCRVALFTAKKIEPGEKLHYDYNAGVEGKTVLEWAKTGFYDTSNFF